MSNTVTPKVVTRKLLNQIANRIWNVKTGKFKKLCKDNLVEGKLHCGIGEIYCTVFEKEPTLITTRGACYAIARAFGPGHENNSMLVDTLEDIANKNDNTDSYRKRAQRVATQIKRVAMLLPE